MADRYEQALREFEQDLVDLIDDHALNLDAESISEMLRAYADEIEALVDDDTERSEVATPLVVDSTPTLERDSAPVLEHDSEALDAASPSSEVVQDQPTVQVDVEAAEMLVADMQQVTAAVEVAPEPRKRVAAGSFPAQPPPLPASARSKPTPPVEAAEQQATDAAPTSSTTTSATGDLLEPDAEPDRVWNPSETLLSSILLQISSSRGAGVLQLRADKHRAQFLIEDGHIWEVRLLPSAPTRSLTSFMDRWGHLTDEQADRLARHAKRHELSEAQTLLQASAVVSPDVVLSAIRGRIRHLIGRLLEGSRKLNEAAYFRVDELPARFTLTSVPTASILFEHARAECPSDGDRQQAKWQGATFARRLGSSFSINQLDLKLHERQLVDCVLDSACSFEQVLEASPLPDHETRAMLAGLRAVGLLTVDQDGTADGEEKSGKPVPRARLEAQVDALETLAADENPFDLFGLHWTTYQDECDRRFQKMREHFSSLRSHAELTPADRERLEAIGERLREAEQTLSTAETRRAYRQQQIPQAQRRRMVRKIEMLGDAAFKRRALSSALDYYQRLLELDAEHAKAKRLVPILVARTNA